MTKKTHGGKRAGAGRKTKYTAPTKSRSVHLPESVWATIDGDGSLTDRLVAAILQDGDALAAFRKALRAARDKAMKEVSDAIKEGDSR